MESKAKLFGHAVHPMLIVLPLGLFVTSVIFDWIHRATKKEEPAKVAHAMICAGIIGGLAAAVPGLIDWLAVPQETRAKRIGLWHGAGNVLVLLFFMLSWLKRRRSPGSPPTSAFLLSHAGLALGTGTAWLGGELVYRLNIGIDTGAEPDAPNSLIEQTGE